MAILYRYVLGLERCYIGRVWRTVTLAMLMIFAVMQMRAQESHASIPCPVMLVSGDADADNIHLSFRNKGKLPIQQVSFSCSPPAHGRSKGAICHTERGIFYPGTEYSIEFANESPHRETHRGSILISAQAAMLGDGNVWVSRPTQACRPLRILRKK
jgi:hypothetical protein